MFAVLKARYSSLVGCIRGVFFAVTSFLTISPGDLGCGTHLAFVAGEMDADSARDGVENVLIPGEPTPDLSPEGRAASEMSSKV